MQANLTLAAQILSLQAMSSDQRAYFRRLLWFMPACILGSGCDLHTKAWAASTLGALPSRSMSVFAPWLEWSLSYNRGTAFSVIGDLGEPVRWLLGGLALLTVVALTIIVVKAKLGRIEAFAFGLIAAGAIGNGYDRAFRHAPGGGTGVIDFIKVNYPWGGSWPTFNVADICVFIGAGLLLLTYLASRKLLRA